MPQVYYCFTENLTEYYEKGLELLTEIRRKKAENIKNEEGKLQNLAAGLLMRNVLGVTNDSMLLFNEHGKPYFEHGKCFSITHSGKYAVLAVSDKEIGADIEKNRELNGKVMERCFTEEETAFAKENKNGFTKIWTLKEAVLKLIGTGLSVSPKTFCVLPVEEKHNLFDREIRFFTVEIDDCILSVAFSGDEDVTLKELGTKELINEVGKEFYES